VTDGGIPLAKTDEGLVARGESASGAYSMVLDPETGVITKLLLPDEELEIAFANFIYLDM
jgi:hypothetical protein